MNTRHLAMSALLASVLALTACGNGGNDTASSPTNDGSSTAEQTSKANDADVAFLTGMKPHHEQAVEMSDIVLAANPPADVAAIARKIQAAQDPEIEQMDTMLADLGQDGSAEHGEGHSAGGHGGMMSDQDLAALEDASGDEAARLYLEAMIVHHEGAIEASETEIEEGQYEPAVELANSIAEEQAAEITEMRALLSRL